jgi:hypothetical protein
MPRPPKKIIEPIEDGSFDDVAEVMVELFEDTSDRDEKEKPNDSGCSSD